MLSTAAPASAHPALAFLGGTAPTFASHSGAVLPPCRAPLHPLRAPTRPARPRPAPRPRWSASLDPSTSSPPTAPPSAESNATYDAFLFALNARDFQLALSKLQQLSPTPDLLAHMRSIPPPASALPRILDIVPSIRHEAAHPNEPTAERLTAAYSLLHRAGLLPSFGAYRSARSLFPPRPLVKKITSVQSFVQKTGTPFEALVAGKKSAIGWVAAGIGTVAASIAALKYGLKADDAVMPALAVSAALFVTDVVALKGALFETILRTVRPVYKRKVVCHEAGHFLVAYLLGCPVRGYTLSAWESLRDGVPGQAGTIFIDKEFLDNINRGKLKATTIDRYSIVAMAGIAAEAVVFGQAEGGEADERALLAVLLSLSPPWEQTSIVHQARWAVSEAIVMIKEQRAAYDALEKALEEGRSISECVNIIEKHIDVERVRASSSPSLAAASATGQPLDAVSSELIELEAEEADLRARQSELEDEMGKVSRRIAEIATRRKSLTEERDRERLASSAAVAGMGTVGTAVVPGDGASNGAGNAKAAQAGPLTKEAEQKKLEEIAMKERELAERIRQLDEQISRIGKQ